MRKRKHPPVRWPVATFINMATVSLGSFLGLSLQQAFPPDVQTIVFYTIGLGTLVLGMQMSLRMPDGYLLVFFFSLILGGITGELLAIDQGLDRLGEQIKTGLNIGEAKFTEGWITAFLLFCIGSVTLIGAIEEGLEGRRELLLIKSVLDGFTSIALAATYGIGVWFSIFPMLLFQGGITLLAGTLRPLLSARRVALLSAVGGALILGIGIQMLQLAELPLENMLPALILLFPLAYLAERSGLIGLILRRKD